MALAVTPLEVAPPLEPEKEMHGGEYGSPGTCSPAQLETTPGAVVLPDAPDVTEPPGVVTLEEEEVELCVPAVLAGPDAELEPLANWPGVYAVPLPVLAAVSPVVLGTVLGTTSAMTTSSTANTASGPYPRKTRCQTLNADVGGVAADGGA